MKYILDTCVISELIKPNPAEVLMEWLSGQPEEALFLSVLTLGELSSGINRLPAGKKKLRLQNWLQTELVPRFSERLISVDSEIADCWGQLTAEAVRNGRTIPVIDGLLVATAIVHGMTFVTRDDGEIRATGAMILNPWIRT